MAGAAGVAADVALGGGEGGREQKKLEQLQTILQFMGDAAGRRNVSSNGFIFTEILAFQWCLQDRVRKA
jgi:hypothetical protein